jgi:hypothetical protein
MLYDEPPLPVCVVVVNPVLTVVPELDFMVVYIPVIELPAKFADLTVRSYFVAVVLVLKYTLAVKSSLRVIVLVLLVDPSPQWSNVR